MTPVIGYEKAVRNTLANAGKQLKVAQYTKEGVYVDDHESISAAAKSLGKKSSGSICNALNPKLKQKVGYGFKWKYI